MEMKARIEIGFKWEVGEVNLNEIVYRVDELKDELLRGLIEQVVIAYQEVVVERIAERHRPEERKGLGRHFEKGSKERLCRGRKCTRSGFRREERCVSTKFGTTRFELRQVKCGRCGRVFCPVLDALDIDPYRRREDVLEEAVLSAVVDTNYRRLLEGHAIDLSLGSVHNYVVGSDIDEQMMKELKLDDFAGIMGDGTGLKKAKGKRGEMRVLIGITHAGSLEPIGSWVDTPWEEIEDQVKARIKEKPEQPPLFVYDGEPGLDDFLSGFVDGHQRCTWHGPRGLYHAMWEDGFGRKDSKPLQKTLAKIVAIEIPEGDYELLSLEQRQEVADQYQTSRQQMDALIDLIAEQGCPSAVTYLDNLLKGLYHQVECWIATGVVAPHTTSRLERVFRELGRRLKRIAWGWSDIGATKLSQMILIKKYQPELWKQLWLDKMGIRGNFQIWITSISTAPTS